MAMNGHLRVTLVVNKMPHARILWSLRRSLETKVEYDPVFHLSLCHKTVVDAARLEARQMRVEPAAIPRELNAPAKVAVDDEVDAAVSVEYLANLR